MRNRRFRTLAHGRALALLVFGVFLVPALQAVPLTFERTDFVATAPAAGARFGTSVALSQDGNTAIVGSVNGGAAYVFVRTGGVWSLEAQLLPQQVTEEFGYSVALSPDGTVALVAGLVPQGCTGLCNVVYVFSRSGSSWAQEKVLQDPLSDFDVIDDRFGTGLALSEAGAVALIGDPFELCFTGIDCGVTYVYSRDGGAWTLQTQIVPTGVTFETSGYSISLTPDGTTALIGSPGAGCASGSSCGAAHLFVESGGTWVQQATLRSSDLTFGDSFGLSVALSAAGDTALIGARYNDCPTLPDCGSAYVFTGGGATWTEQRKLEGATAGELLGAAVALSADGQAALIGSRPDDCTSRPDCGGVFWALRMGQSWSEPARIFTFPPVPPFLGQFDPFRVLRALALSSDGRTALAGDPDAACAAGSACGAAYVFSISPLSAFEVPTLGDLGLILLALLLAASGAVVLARRRRSA